MVHCSGRTSYALRFKLRTLLACVTAIALPLAWFAHELQVVRERRSFLEVARSQTHYIVAGSFMSVPRIPIWRNWLGDTAEHQVILPWGSTVVDVERAAALFPEADIDVEPDPTPIERESMHILVVTADLMTSSKIHGAAARINSDALIVIAAAYRPASGSKSEEDFDLVIFDLTTSGLDVAKAIERLRDLNEPPKRIIAFGPHVHEQLLQKARDAGCDAVYARGQFYARLDEILAEPLGD